MFWPNKVSNGKLLEHTNQETMDNILKQRMVEMAQPSHENEPRYNCKDSLLLNKKGKGNKVDQERHGDE
jgi:hypothetical protein